VHPPAADPRLLRFAVALSERAGSLAAERFFAADFSTAIKPDGTEVTGADLAVEALIRRELADRFPADGVHGEETGTTPGTSGRRWIIDPIDGTWYFAHRIPVFGTNLALEDEHGPALAVVNQPVARQLVHAGRGLGCRVRTDGNDKDLAPLPVILEEAGGRATDLHGRPLLAGDGTALLSTGRHHDALVALLSPLAAGG
jgi:histidinol-phosphatase